MKTEFPYNKSELIKFINTQYNLNVKNLIFIPKGEVGYCYTVNCNNDKKYFLKIFNNSRLANTSTQNLEFSLNASAFLCNEKGIKNISYPIRTLDNSFISEFNNNKIVLYNFIEGEDFDNKSLPKEIIVQLAKLLATIHKKTKNSIIDNAVYEKFAIDFKEDLLKSILFLKNGSNLNTKYKKQLAKLVLPFENKILKALKKLENLSKNLNKNIKKEDFVIVHRDPICANLILDKNNQINIIDWDDPIFGPVEHDIWFYLEGHQSFLPTYREIYNIDINFKVIEFNIYKRLLADITDWVYRISFEKQSDEQNQSDLIWLQEDCLNNFDYLTEKEINKIKNIIKNKPD